MKYKVQQIFYHCLAFYQVFFKGAIPVFWFSGKTNVGDALNPYLIGKLSNKKVVWVNPKIWRLKHYFAVGSILHFATSKSIVWGSGVISKERNLPNVKKVLAVRGPLTREILISRGFDCPKVYGDPALLLPRFYDKQVKTNHLLGVIPHYKEKDSEIIKRLATEPNVLIIDVETDEVEAFIDKIRSCQYIVSSSLHGIIIADAYKVPSKWMHLSSAVEGDGFKFHDYSLAVKNKEMESLAISDDIDSVTIASQIENIAIDFDFCDLLENCPFTVDCKNI